ncbi:hypothetical protein T01_14151 [Trichinella spiralis]|uniref:Uncharacterized protein n=1 Tax=Trichinella spiralis TaxID=6334 RepID=A0A0V1B162_TRISP|nr:hypothetical protein T01_14151 [Trichinella spiralis]
MCISTKTADDTPLTKACRFQFDKTLTYRCVKFYSNFLIFNHILPTYNGEEASSPIANIAIAC